MPSVEVSPTDVPQEDVMEISLQQPTSASSPSKIAQDALLTSSSSNFRYMASVPEEAAGAGLADMSSSERNDDTLTQGWRPSGEVVAEDAPTPRSKVKGASQAVLNEPARAVTSPGARTEEKDIKASVADPVASITSRQSMSSTSDRKSDRTQTLGATARPWGATQPLRPQTPSLIAAQAQESEGPSDAELAHTGSLSASPPPSRQKRLSKHPQEKPRVSSREGFAAVSQSFSGDLSAGVGSSHFASPTPDRPCLPPIGKQHMRHGLVSSGSLGTIDSGHRDSSNSGRHKAQIGPSKTPPEARTKTQQPSASGQPGATGSTSSPTHPFGEESVALMHDRLGRMYRDSTRPSSGKKRWGGMSPVAHSGRSHTSSCPTLPHADVCDGDDEDDYESVCNDELSESNAMLRSMLSTLRPNYERLRDENEKLRRRLLRQSHQHKHSSPMGHL